MARYGQTDKSRVVARRLPRESSAVEVVLRAEGVCAATRGRWRSGALAVTSGERPDARTRRWAAAARLEAVIAKAATDEA